jgi:hypothetical protein
MTGLGVVRVAVPGALVLALAHSALGRAKCTTDDARYALQLVSADDEGWGEEVTLWTHVQGISLYGYSSSDPSRVLEAARE